MTGAAPSASAAMRVRRDRRTAPAGKPGDPPRTRHGEAHRAPRGRCASQCPTDSAERRRPRAGSDADAREARARRLRERRWSTASRASIDSCSMPRGRACRRPSSERLKAQAEADLGPFPRADDHARRGRARLKRPSTAWCASTQACRRCRWSSCAAPRRRPDARHREARGRRADAGASRRAGRAGGGRDSRRARDGAHRAGAGGVLFAPGGTRRPGRRPTGAAATWIPPAAAASTRTSPTTASSR